tara:strand:+ start:1979 stop:2179 length:201 start_codon:yes stop_codon:yes gene_type:complete
MNTCSAKTKHILASEFNLLDYCRSFHLFIILFSIAKNFVFNNRTFFNYIEKVSTKSLKLYFAKGPK